MEYRVFQGVIHKHQWPFWSRVFFHGLGGRFGDHRGWAAIDAWAQRIALALPIAGVERAEVVPHRASRTAIGRGRIPHAPTNRGGADAPGARS